MGDDLLLEFGVTCVVVFGYDEFVMMGYLVGILEIWYMWVVKIWCVVCMVMVLNLFVLS